jgi:hypothetical protein
MPMVWRTLAAASLLLVLCGQAWAADAAFDLRKEASALRKDIEAVHGVLDQAGGSAPLEDKKKAVERFAQLKAAVQAFSDRAIAAGKTEEEVGDVLERFQFNALSTMERDLKAAINEGAKPVPGKE